MSNLPILTNLISSRQALPVQFAGLLTFSILTFGGRPLWGAYPTGAAQQGTNVPAPEQANSPTTEPSGSPPTQSSDSYVIGPSDVLAIDVWKDPELTRTIPVRPDGKITLPLIGDLQVSGLTAPRLQHLITERLTEYISKPEVTVIVQAVKSQTYTVVGKIAHPGSYPLGKPTTVLEAIAIAGGFQEFARPKKVYVLRRGEASSREKLPFDYNDVVKGKHLEQNVDLKSGDTVVVP